MRRKKIKYDTLGINAAELRDPCCSAFWVLIVAAVVVALSGTAIGVTLIFFPDFVYGTNSSVPTPAPTPSPSPTPTPTSVPTPSPTPFPANHTGPCCQTNELLPSCMVTTVADGVCRSAGYEQCCLAAWNLTCVTKSVVLGLQTCNPLDCCTRADSGNTPFVSGCANLLIQNQVCAVDPSCCSRVWDKTCAGFAIEMGLQQCSSEDCCVPSGLQGCANTTTTNAVCALDKSCCTRAWTSSCVGIALRNNFLNGTCSTEPCCVSAIPGLSSNYLGCNDPETNRLVCAEMPSCCSYQWTSACAAKALNLSLPCIGQPVNSCCNISSRGGCNELDVMRKVCSVGGHDECCGYPHGWSADCISAAIKGPEKPVMRCLFDSCCTVHAKPGCNDTNITEAVCAVLPSCCTAGWGSACVELVLNFTNTTAELCEFRTDCCRESDTPGCNKIEVVRDVCIRQGLGFCCDSDYGWSEQCIRAALKTGLVACSNSSCCVPVPAVDARDPPLGCNNPETMKFVCETLGLHDCCTVSWGNKCVEQGIRGTASIEGCQTPALPAAFNGSCCEISDSPGCNNLDTAAYVCADEQKIACCSEFAGWGPECVTAAIRAGAEVCNADSCYEPNNNAGCNSNLVNKGVCGKQFAEYTQGSVCYAETLHPDVELKLRSCCDFECANNADCGAERTCTGNQCCDLDANNLCNNCVCTASVSDLTDCAVLTNGDYVCPQGIEGACVVFPNFPNPDIIKCCERELMYCTDTSFHQGWDETCAFAGLCVGQKEDINEFIQGDTDCCTPSPTGSAGCSTPDIAAAVCALSLSGRPEFAAAAQCCTNSTLRESGNVQFEEGWIYPCVGLGVSQGLQICSPLSNCCVCSGSQGCDNSTVNEFVCNSTEKFIDGAGQPVNLLECCTVGWSLGCIEYATQQYHLYACPGGPVC